MIKIRVINYGCGPKYSRVHNMRRAAVVVVVVVAAAAKTPTGPGIVVRRRV